MRHASARMRLAATALAKLGRCVESAVALRMEEDALPGSQTGGLEARRDALVARCEADFGRVGQASVKLIDAIHASCECARPRRDAVRRRRGDRRARVRRRPASGRPLLFVQAPRHSDAIRTLLGVTPSRFETHLRTFVDPRCVNVDE